MTFAEVPDAPLSTLAPPKRTGTPLTWPPTGRQVAWKPTGGFFLCPTDYLLLPWGLYRAGRLDFFGLRTWLGLLELPERRCDVPEEKDVHYSLKELGQLLDMPRRAPVQTALRTLEELGLVQWSMSAIRYLPQRAALRDQALPPYETLRAQLPAWRTWVPAPRRILRWLAREGTPGLCATAAGVMLRCLWSKQRHCVSGGRVAARWIAQGFGLAERTVQRALDTFEELNWLARLPRTDAADAALERRFGARTVVNLRWNVPGAAEDEDDDPAPVPPPPRRDTPRPARQEGTVEHFVKHSGNPDQNLSPTPGDFDQNLSPTPAAQTPETPGKSSDCTRASGLDFYPFQEERQRPDPLPASPARAREDLATAQPLLRADLVETPRTGDEQQQAEVTPPPHPAVLDPAVVASAPLRLDEAAEVFAALPAGEQEVWLEVTTARLLAQGWSTALLIRPVVLAEVYADLARHAQAAAPGETSPTTPVPVAPALPVVAPAASPAVRPPLRQAAPGEPFALADPAAAFAALPASEQQALLEAATSRLLAAGQPAALLIRPVVLAEVYAHLAPPPPVLPNRVRAEAPPADRRPPVVALAPAVPPGAAASADLRDVVPADLRDVTRLEALRQQAIRRGWVTESAADRLNFVAAAMHARRKGKAPCALFVAIVRDKRWELITDRDEDEARALLRQHDPRLGRRPAVAPPRLSDDACVVRFVEQTLRNAGSAAEGFAALMAYDATWTRERWEAARAELHGSIGRGLERLGEVLGEELEEEE